MDGEGGNRVAHTAVGRLSLAPGEPPLERIIALLSSRVTVFTGGATAHFPRRRQAAAPDQIIAVIIWSKLTGYAIAHLCPTPAGSLTAWAANEKTQEAGLPRADMTRWVRRVFAEVYRSPGGAALGTA